MIVDFYSDKDGKVLKNFLEQNNIELAKLEKTASLNEEWPPYSALTKEAFADPDLKMFPIFSKTAALTSAMYIKAQSDEIPYAVKKRAQDACELFGIDEDLVGFKKIAMFNKKQDLLESDFIFPEKRKLPVVDEETWQLSKDVFLKVANELSFDDLVVGSRRLIKKASELGIDEVDEELKTLGLVNKYIDTEKLEDLSRDRFMQTSDDSYLKLAKIASEIPNKEAHFLLKELIDLDRKHSTDESAIVLKKIASQEKDDIINIGGEAVPTEKIASISSDEWRDVFPYSDIDFFLNDDKGFDKQAFETLYQTLSPIEQDVVESFIQNKL